MSHKAYHGIIPPLVTPLIDRDKLDFIALESLIEHVLAGGVHGIFALGTTGEGPSLSWNQQRQVIQHTCVAVADRVPVLVGITATSLDESIALARFSADRGASAVVVAPPPYFPIAQSELTAYVRKLAAELSLPLFLYNMPTHAKITFEPETLRQLIDIPNIIGLKDSGGGMGYLHRVAALIAAHRPEWSLLIGPEELLAESVLLGGDGGVAGGANLFPRLYVDLYEAAAAGNLACARELHRQVMRVGEIYRVGQTPCSVIAGIKAGLAHLGIGDGTMAPPLSGLCDDERTQIATIVDRLGVY